MVLIFASGLLNSTSQTVHLHIPHVRSSLTAVSILNLFSDPTCVLLPPRQICNPSNPLDPALARKITICLSTRYDKSMAVIRKYFDPANVEQWAKVQRLDGGDRMLASSMMHAELEDQRDATYVRVSACGR